MKVPRPWNQASQDAFYSLPDLYHDDFSKARDATEGAARGRLIGWKHTCVGEWNGRQEKAGTHAMSSTDPQDAKPKRGPPKRAADQKMLDDGSRAQLQAHLGKNLKAIYQAVVDEPVPERLIKLLDELDELERRENDN
jgi:Anti-sigma factor NepR